MRVQVSGRRTYAVARHYGGQPANSTEWRLCAEAPKSQIDQLRTLVFPD